MSVSSVDPPEPAAHRSDREALLAEHARVAERRLAEAEQAAAEAEQARKAHDEHLMHHFWADIAAERERDRVLRRGSVVPTPPDRFLSH